MMTDSRPVGLSNPGFCRRLDELSRTSDLIWFSALNVGLASTLVAVFFFPQSASGNFWAYAGLFVRSACYLWAGDGARGRGGEVLAGLFKLGLVAGVFELLVDWWLIHWIANGQLVYLTGNDVVLLGSPVWMPLAWACVIVELGYPAIRLYGLLKGRVTDRAAAIAATITVGYGLGYLILEAGRMP
jgi:hypothetical protein